MTLEQFAQHLLRAQQLAKLLWGEPKVLRTQHIGRSATLDDIDGAQPGWQYHLKHMVIAKDPVKYLQEHI